MIGTKFKAIVGNDLEWIVVSSHELFSNTWKCYPANKDFKNIKESLIQYFSSDFIKENEIYDKE